VCVCVCVRVPMYVSCLCLDVLEHYNANVAPFVGSRFVAFQSVLQEVQARDRKIYVRVRKLLTPSVEPGISLSFQRDQSVLQ
jgi:hypothetical protein